MDAGSSPNKHFSFPISSLHCKVFVTRVDKFGDYLGNEAKWLTYRSDYKLIKILCTDYKWNILCCANAKFI